MTDDPATTLDIGVVLVVVVTAAASLLVLVASLAEGRLLAASYALAVVVALVATLAVLWLSPRLVVLQLVALAAIAAVTWLSGFDPVHLWSYLSIMVLIATAFRHLEEARLAHDRAERLSERP